MTELTTGSDLVTDARKADQAVLARLHGEIGLHNSSEVRVALLRLLQQHCPGKLILDLSDVPSMDSSAIAVLVELLKTIRKHGGMVYLTHLHARVRALLEIVRLDTTFVLTDDEETAMRD